MKKLIVLLILLYCISADIIQAQSPKLAVPVRTVTFITGDSAHTFNVNYLGDAVTICVDTDTIRASATNDSFAVVVYYKTDEGITQSYNATFTRMSDNTVVTSPFIIASGTRNCYRLNNPHVSFVDIIRTDSFVTGNTDEAFIIITNTGQ